MDFLRLPRLLAATLLLGSAPVLVPLHAAMAQMSLGSGGDADRDAQDAAAKAEAKAAARAAAPPPAIPGAVSDEATATSGHVNTDMEPTAALFDAINRGDLTSAKEALGRGADLNGRSVLNQSPLDMAIDLNRSDITFLLLSMRNSENGAPVASVVTASSAAVSPAGAARSTARGGRHGKPATTRERAESATRRLADSGGAPNPGIGFLGFGGS